MAAQPRFERGLDATLVVVIGTNHGFARVVEVSGTETRTSWQRAAQLQYVLERIEAENSGKTHFGRERLDEWRKEYRALAGQLPHIWEEINPVQVGQVYRRFPDGYLSMTPAQVSTMASFAP